MLPITRVKIGVTGNREQGLLLISDLHIGSSHVDYGALQSDLARAVERKDHIVVLGDVFDAITPKDLRYNPTALATRIRNTDAVHTAAVEWAVEILGPAAKVGLLDLICYGNHETAAIRHASVDLLADLGTRLGVSVGGYAGVVLYTLPLGRTCKVFYWHGHGRGSGQTSVLRAWARMAATCLDADVLWTAHHHQRMVGHVSRLVPGRKTLERRDVLQVITGSYLNPYSDFDGPVKGKRDNYAGDALLTPGGIGGVRLVLGRVPGRVIAEF